MARADTGSRVAAGTIPQTVQRCGVVALVLPALAALALLHHRRPAANPSPAWWANKRKNCLNV